MSRARRILLLVIPALLSLLVMSPAAMGADGVGVYGRTDDKVVTFFAFGLMIFFVLLVIGLSLLQWRLDSRKERAREELERLRRL